MSFTLGNLLLSCSATVLSCAFALNENSAQLLVLSGTMLVLAPSKLKGVAVVQPKRSCEDTGKPLPLSLMLEGAYNLKALLVKM